MKRATRMLSGSTAASPGEGFEAPLTLHRLGVCSALGMSLKTTNCLESVSAFIEQRTDTVDRWRSVE